MSETGAPNSDSTSVAPVSNRCDLLVVGCTFDRFRPFVWLLVLATAVWIVDGLRVRWADWEVTPRYNINLAEALAWHQGTLELSGAQRESAKFDGRQLNAFPPGFTFISYAAVGLNHLINGRWEFPAWAFRLIVGVPILCITFWAMRTACSRGASATVLSLGFLLGTPMLVMLSLCRIGGFFEVNHVLACCGILLIAGDALGARRVWPAVVGFAMAFWTRQLTVLYMPVIAWMIWSLPANRRLRSATIAAAGVVVVLGAYAFLNTLKFGSPLESGYLYIYEGRTDAIAERARAGLFRPEYVKGNLRYMMFEPPGVRIGAGGVERALNDFGAGIWLTCPVLLAVVLTAGQWWRDRARRYLMIASLGVMTMLLMYHNTGWRQPGYYRFCLDFVPVWFLVIAPYLWGRYRTAATCAAIAWSIWYFHFITFNNLAWAGVPD